MTVELSEMTNEKLLEAWDKGEEVWSCEYSGRDAEHERTVQRVGMAALQAMLDSPPDSWAALTGDKNISNWTDYQAKIRTAACFKKAVRENNPTGAQLSAALSLGSLFAEHGYEDAMNLVPEERKILVSKDMEDYA